MTKLIDRGSRSDRTRAALAVVLLVFAACSSETNPIEREPPRARAIGDRARARERSRGRSVRARSR